MVKVSKEVLEKSRADVDDARNRIRDRYGNDSVFEKPLHEVTATNLDDLYFQTILGALQHGELNPVEEGSHAGEMRLEYPGYACCVKYPTTRPFAPISRDGIPVATDNNTIKKYFQDDLLDGALRPNQHYTYAAWISGIPEFYSFNKCEELGIEPGKSREIDLEHYGIPRGTRFNQLEWCANHFANKGFGTNHCAITIGCAEGLKRYDLPYKGETERGSTECLRQITLKIRNENQLDVSTFWRSWDLFEGFPQNLGGFAHFIEYTTELINAFKKDDQPEVVPGRLYAYSDGLHIYSHSIPLAKLWTNTE